ncbi:MAG: PKD domain-containing protein [Bacteroidales bacterium]|nr:PKD domain-containing protein [Bacteroidales bacterium]
MTTLSTSLNDSVFIEDTFKINNKALVSKTFYLFETTNDTTDAVVLTVNPLPNANAGPDKDVCLLEGVGIGPSVCYGHFSYLWNNSNSLTSSNICNPIASPSVATTYTLTVTNTVTGCSNTDEVVVTVLPLPEPEITVTGLPCYNSNDLTFHSNTFISYSWNFGDPNSGTSNYSTAQNPTHSFSMPGTFQVTLTVTDENGCVGCTSHIIQIAQHCCAFDTIIHYNDNDAEFLSGEIWNPSHQIIWNTPLRFNKTLIIKAGNTLTIAAQNTIEFGPFGKLIVENGNYTQDIEGAQLVMETGAVFTSIFNTVGDECLVMWQGVEVWGNASLSHNTTYVPYQGKITMGIRAEINHAHIGVLLGRRNICFTNTCDDVSVCRTTPYLLNYSGGIIDACCSSKFKTDAVAVHFASYKHVNASTIEGCDFQGGSLLDPGYNTNNAYVYQNNNISTSHNPLFGNANVSGRSDVGIYMWGIRFAPEYITTIPHYPFKQNDFTNMETGMLSYTSRYNVTGSNFDNLTYGIKIYNYNSAVQGNTIFNNQFKEINYNYINLNGCKYDKIKSNIFGLTTQAQGSKCGILLNNSSNFEISDNDFNKLNTGIICYNSSKGGGNIKAKDRILNVDNTGNFFNRCQYNLKTYRNNARLNIKCNTADNPEVISGEYSEMNWYNASFPFSYLGNQGYADMLDNTRQAGNKFTPANDQYPQNDKKQIENAGWPYTYNAHPNVYARIPVKYNIASPILINTSSANYVDGVSCATCLLPNCNISTRIMQNSDTIALFENELDTVKSYLDSSHTSALLEAISSALTYEELADSLLHNSPLSDTLLKAFIVRDDSVIAASFLDVFLHNAPVSDSIWVYYMPDLLSLLHEDTVQLITEAQAQFNVYRTPALIERYIEQLKSEKQMFLIEYITQLADSGYFDDAVKFLENENTSDAQQTIIAQYLYDGIADTALYKLNDFEPQTSADSAWKELMVILIGLEAGDSTVFDISEAQEDFIRELAYGEDINLAAVSAQAILRLLYGETFELDLSEPEPRKQTQENTEKAIEQKSENWDLYPNPARNYVDVQYQIPAESNGVVEMYSLIGEKLEHAEIPSGKNNVRIFTQKFSAGVYLVKLVVDDKYMGTKKLVILKK